MTTLTNAPLLLCAQEAATVVNCAGPWAGAVAATHGMDLPITPRRRSVFQVACNDPRYTPTDENPICPLIVDPTGVYVRGDGPGTFLCGVSPGEGDEDPDEPPLDVDYDWFEERVWPCAAPQPLRVLCPRPLRNPRRALPPCFPARQDRLR